ncbi:MAG: DUF2147 domain-containing protein [Crocinitomicaceae bacterium]
MKKFTLLLISCCIIQFAFSQQKHTVEGKWVTIDDKTQKPKSIVELQVNNNILTGRIIKLYPRAGRPPNVTCTLCTDDRKNQLIEGLQIIRGLKKSDGEWSGGTVVDPASGKVYSCKIWLDPNNANFLNLRGYIGIFYRTQKWVRYTGGN